MTTCRGTEFLPLTFDKTSDQTKRHNHAGDAGQKLRPPADDVEHETSYDGDYEVPAVDYDLDLSLGHSAGDSRLC